MTGFLKSDTEEVCAAAAREKAHAGDTLYATWHDNQIRQGNDEIKQHDLRVCDHPHLGNRCEAPDQVGPPISYMEELRVFRMPVSMNNPMGLCQFYHTSPEKANILVGPKLAECACRIHGLIQIAKRMGQQLTVVVLKESLSLLGVCLANCTPGWLYRDLTFTHLKRPRWGSAYACIVALFAYVIKNDTALLDHIIIGHYWGSFSCGKCLAFAADTAGQMKRHFILCGQSDMEHHRARSTCAVKCIRTRNLVAHTREERRKRTGLALQNVRSSAVHQQGPIQWLPPRSMLRGSRST